VSVLAYVSGHGFGHWTRSEPILAALAAEVPVHVRTSARALGQARRADWAASVTDVDVGPGVVQQGPLAVDVPATRHELAAHLERWPALVAAEAQAARQLGARLVYGDVPPLAFAAAAEAGVPSLGLANFTWSWTYEHYAGQDPFFGDAAARLARAEGLATHAVYLPGGGGLEALGPPALEAAIRRRPTCSPSAARGRLRELMGDPERPLVLLSFGGYGHALDLSDAARRNPDYAFLAFSEPSAPPPENLTILPHDHGLPHQDLVLGAHALIAKPGYGTISECLTRPTPFAYVIPGDGFREHRHLETIVRRWLPHARLTPEQLVEGRWGPALERALAATPAEAAPPSGVDDVVTLARSLLS
jgi:hypothetical protein